MKNTGPFSFGVHSISYFASCRISERVVAAAVRRLAHMQHRLPRKVSKDRFDLRALKLGEGRTIGVSPSEAVLIQRRIHHAAQHLNRRIGLEVVSKNGHTVIHYWRVD